MAEEKKQGFVEHITPRDVDFSQWYTDVILKSQLVDYAPVRGCMIMRPYGYAIWERIREEMDKRFKATGHENVYMPMLDPRKPAFEGSGARGRLRSRSGVGHPGRQRKAAGASGYPSHQRDHFLRHVLQVGQFLARSAHEVQPVVQRHALGKEHPSLPAHQRIPVAGGPYHPRHCGRSAGRNHEDAGECTGKWPRTSWPCPCWWARRATRKSSQARGLPTPWKP